MKRKLIAIGIAVGFVIVAMIAASIWVQSAVTWPGPLTPAEADAEGAAVGSYFLPSVVVGVVIAALYYWLSAPKKAS